MPGWLSDRPISRSHHPRNVELGPGLASGQDDVRARFDRGHRRFETGNMRPRRRGKQAVQQVAALDAADRTDRDVGLLGGAADDVRHVAGGVAIEIEAAVEQVAGREHEAAPGVGLAVGAFQRGEPRLLRRDQVVGAGRAFGQVHQLAHLEHRLEDDAGRDRRAHFQDDALRPAGRRLEPLGPPRRGLGHLGDLADQQDDAVAALHLPHRRAGAAGFDDDVLRLVRRGSAGSWRRNGRSDRWRGDQDEGRGQQGPEVCAREPAVCRLRTGPHLSACRAACGI
jgi:hypothetical protein